MTIGININGRRVVVPGVYDTFQVEDSLANVTPGARNVLIIGEAEKGAPGDVVDLRGIQFSNYPDLKEYFGSGPIVDAARSLFTTQADPVFTGSVGTVYVYKTNASTLATSEILQNGSAYGELNSIVYGEEGNLIRRSVTEASTEVLPTFSSYFVPQTTSIPVSVRVNGQAEQSATLAANATPVDFVSTINGLTGIAASGGDAMELVSAAQVTALDKIAAVASGSQLTLTTELDAGGASTFQGTDVGSLTADDILYIPTGSAIAGGSGENVGAYRVISASASQIVVTKIEGQPTSVTAVVFAGVDTEIAAWNQVTVEITEAPLTGSGASLEIYASSGDSESNYLFFDKDNLKEAVTAEVATSASMSLTYANGMGTFAITGGAFNARPSVGDVIWVNGESVLAGSGKENVGAWIVKTAGKSNIVTYRASSYSTPTTPLSISSTNLSGQTNPFETQPQILSNSLWGKTWISSSERAVSFEAVRQTDGVSLPDNEIGGRIPLVIAYRGGDATLSIDSNRILTTSTGLRIILRKFPTLSDLVVFINAQSDYEAKIPSSEFNSQPTDFLDEVEDLPIGTEFAGAFNGRIKSDFYDVEKFFNDNFIVIGFQAATTLDNKAGLPDAAEEVFLTGGTLGSTNDAAVLAGFDAGLKVNVRQVVPLFSRDATEDIADGLTDENSSYTIEAINASAKAHVLTASNVENRKERFAKVSIHDTFENSKDAARALSSERCQMAFEMLRTTNSEGNIQWFLPWMVSVVAAAGRSQAILGTSLLRKSFTVTDVKHIGDESLYSDKLTLDFDPDGTQLAEAIEAGLFTLRAVDGFGVRVESPDLSTRSRENDPKAWVYERINVLFTCDEVRQTVRNVLENYIGNRISDTSPAVIRNAVANTLKLFVSNGSLLQYEIVSVVSVGNGYQVKLSIFPTEAVESIVLDVLARRTTG